MLYTLVSANVAGSGTAQDLRQSDKVFAYLEVSGQPASASILGSPDGVKWLVVTAWTGQAIGTTATAQLAGFYPYLMGQVDWVSGGTRTANVNMALVGRTVKWGT